MAGCKRISFVLIYAVFLLTSCSLSPASPHYPLAESGALNVTLLAKLPAEVDESSGLAMRDGRLWTHNDSGHAATLYQLSEAGDAISRRVHIKNAANYDWEALAQDSDWLYIADCGNNIGDRSWLQIYKVAWQDLEQAEDGAEVVAKRIMFRLADTEPSTRPHAHNDDCEALTVVGDELWLFTKNWQDRHTRLYRLDKTAAVQEVVSSERFFTNGLITGADFDPDTERLALVGYRLGFLSVAAFIWQLPVINNTPQWELGQYHVIRPTRQWEAILWHQGDLLLTSEASLLGGASLGRIAL